MCMVFPICKKIVPQKARMEKDHDKSPNPGYKAGLLVVSWDITQWQLTFCPLTLPQPSHSCLFPLSQADLSCQLIDNVSLLRCHVMLLSMWKYIKCPSLLYRLWRLVKIFSHGKPRLDKCLRISHSQPSLCDAKWHNHWLFQIVLHFYFLQIKNTIPGLQTL